MYVFVHGIHYLYVFPIQDLNFVELYYACKFLCVDFHDILTILYVCSINNENIVVKFWSTDL